MPSPGVAKMVLFQSSSIPYFVTTRESGQYLCDTSCPQWVSLQIWSHTLAAAEDSGQLFECLQWYVRTQPCPNITTLGMQGMPSNGGKKLFNRKRLRKRQADTDPNVYVPRPALSSIAQPSHSTKGMSSYYWEADRVANTSTSLFMYPSVPSYLGQLPHPSMYPTCSAAINTPQLGSSPGATSGGMSSTGPSNPNPFYLKFITGNIRICQGADKV